MCHYFCFPVTIRCAWYTEMNMGHNTDNTSVGGLNFGADSSQDAATSEVSAITVYGYQK